MVLAAADTLFLAFFMFDLAYIDAFQYTPPQWYNREEGSQSCQSDEKRHL